MAYEIGYRRPPTSGRFKSGTSGNSKGRPKGAHNFMTLLDKELAQHIIVTENGRKTRVTRLQAMIKRLVAGALQGEQKALLTLVEILRRAGGFEPAAVNDLLPANYAAILDAYVDARRKTVAQGPEPESPEGEKS